MWLISLSLLLDDAQRHRRYRHFTKSDRARHKCDRLDETEYLEFQPLEYLFGLKTNTNQEVPKLTVDCADLIKTHFVDDFLEVIGVVDEKRYTPFPSV